MTLAISTNDVFQRAQFWVDQGVTYSQQGQAADPAGRNYRTDCSGLCCMAFGFETTRFTTHNFRNARGMVSVGSLRELRAGDALLKLDHMELFVRWRNPADPLQGAFVYSFNSKGETVRNPYRPSNHGKLGFNDWDEMSTYQVIRYSNLSDSVPGTEPTPEHPVLRKGSSGAAVSALQALLSEHGYALAVDGEFGPKTEQAVRAFQAKQGIAVDGIVGDVTWSRLEAVRAFRAQQGIEVDGVVGPSLGAV